MAFKAFVNNIQNIGSGSAGLGFDVAYIDTTANLGAADYIDAVYFGTDITLYTPSEYISTITSKIIAYGSANSYPVTANDITWAAVIPFIASEVTSLKQTINRTYNYPTRSLNTAFQISTASDAFVSYAVDVTASLSLITGQTGLVTLQYADNSGFTTNVKTVHPARNGNTGTLTIGLALGQTVTMSLVGMIPAGKYVKIITTNVTGTPAFTMQNAQEVLM